MTALPPGFVLEGQQSTSALPPGFVLEDRSVKADDFWPVRLAKGIYSSVASGAQLPGDVYAGRAQVPQSENMPGGESTENIGRVMDTAGFGLPLNPAVRSGDRAIAGAARNVSRPPAKVPTAEELKDAASAGYTEVRGMGVDLDPRFVQNFAQRAKMELEQSGLDGEVAKQTHRTLDKLSNPPSEVGARTVFSFGNLDTARKTLREVAGNFNKPSDQKAANRAIEWLDGFSTQLPPQAVLAGPAATASKILGDARGNYASAMRSNKITGELDNAVTGAVERGELQAQVANSGRNTDNAIRQRLKSLLQSKREVAGFTPEEIAAIRQVAKGSVGANTARNTGNLLGGGLGGLAAVYGLGGGLTGLATGNPMALAASVLPVAGVGLKGLSSRMTSKQANKLDEKLRKRSPLFQERQQAIPLEANDIRRQAMLLRSLMLSQD